MASGQSYGESNGLVPELVAGQFEVSQVLFGEPEEIQSLTES